MRDAGETQRANLREQGDMQRAGMLQSVGLANAATGAREADTRGRLAEGEIAERSLVSSLRSQYLNENDPAKREQLGQSLMTLQGREPQRPDTSLEQARMKSVSDLFKAYGEQMPLGPDKKTPIPFDEWAAPAMAMIGQQPGGGGRYQ